MGAEDKDPKEPQQQQDPKDPQQQQQQEPQGQQPAEPEGDDLKDKHGQEAVAKGKYQRDISERDKIIKEREERIKELEAQVEEASKTEKGRADLKAEFEAYKADSARKEQAYELKMAGCIDVEAAQALIGDKSVAELKESKPYLFQEETKGATGLKPGGGTGTAGYAKSIKEGLASRRKE